MKLVRKTVEKTRSFLEGGQDHHFGKGVKTLIFGPPEGGSSRIGEKNETCQKECNTETIVFGGGSKPTFKEASSRRLPEGGFVKEAS